MLGVYVFQSVSNQFKEHHPTITVAGVVNVLVAVTCFSLFLGLLLFFFGWLGRVTISTQGVDAPKSLVFINLCAGAKLRRLSQEV